MEITCNRCHQAVPAESCYCPTCGLPQLVYEREDAAPQQPDRWTEAVRDATTVDWRAALRVCLMLAIPAGLLSCSVLPLGLLWMAGGAAWAVSIYVRKQGPAWITVGAGARIGLVTGLLGGWLAFAGSGTSLALLRFAFGQGKQIDEPYQAAILQAAQQLQSMSPDAQTAAAFRSVTAWLLTPQGRAGMVLSNLLLFECGLLLFAAAGGAIGARMMAHRVGRPE